MNLSKALNNIKYFQIVAQAAQKLGVEAYVVGGYVRDFLLERECKDIDIVCVGSGIKLANEVAKSLPDATPVKQFKNFGTAMIRSEDIELEFVGARRESYRRDSRKPIVEDGSLEDDQNRRDFTINALAISLNKDNYGELVDPFGGISDLKEGIIRTPLEPDQTFSDDPLRMMRAIRFATQLEFDIEASTFESITNNADRLNIVSMERITTELNKIILSKTPSYGFKLLFTTGLLHQFFPEMVELHGVETIKGKSHKDNFYHTLQVLDNICASTDNLWLRWAAIMHDIAKPRTKRFNNKVGWTFHGHEEKGARMTKGIFRKLKLPLDDKMQYVSKLVRLHLRPIALVKKDITDSAVRRLLFEAGDDIEDLMKLCRADITSKNDDRVQRYLNNFDLVEEKMKEVEEKDSLRNFEPPISGKDIMDIFGLKPGREVGEIKTEIREAILDGKIGNNYEEAHTFMLEVAKKYDLTPVK